MESMPVWLPLVFFVIALAYATVGFGGGSSYLAVLVLIGLSYRTVPQLALVCNLAVSAGGVWHFYRGGHLDFKKVLPFIVLSVPMAYVGGRLPVARELFVVLLGVSLFVAGARTFVPDRAGRAAGSIPQGRAWGLGVPIGAALGFLAGVVGIGGGIFLAPVLLLAGWAHAKQGAAAAALF
ncbi:MAG: TSUP family transporter, partial [Candidatus Krumholzibacteriia bacterium]